MKWLILPLLAAALLAGCGKPPRAPVGALDTPEHHALVGERLLDKEDYSSADAAFQKALELKKDFGPAYAGRAVVAAKTGDKRFTDLLDKGLSKAANDDEELRVYTLAIRAYTLYSRAGKMEPERMVAKTKDAYGDAVSIMKKKPDREIPEPHYFMGLAYLYGLDFPNAESQFDKVARLKRGKLEEADDKRRLVQKINRAQLNTSIGKRIALLDAISRADMAALLVEELHVERFASRSGGAVARNDFAPPKPLDEIQAEKYYAQTPLDLEGHPLAHDAKTVVAQGIRGLEPFPGNLFAPDSPLTRAEFAMILEDVLVRARNDSQTAVKHFGKPSPFPDVRSDQTYFNAAVNVTTRGLMAADSRDGLFNPKGKIPGVDAVLAVSKLKLELNIFPDR